MQREKEREVKPAQFQSPKFLYISTIQLPPLLHVLKKYTKTLCKALSTVPET